MIGLILLVLELEGSGTGWINIQSSVLIYMQKTSNFLNVHFDWLDEAGSKSGRTRFNPDPELVGGCMDVATSAFATNLLFFIYSQQLGRSS